MLATIVGAALAVVLVPGYWFLIQTEDVRRPRVRSSLEETLQVAMVGLATTGSATTLVALLAPRSFLRTSLVFQSPTETASPHDLRFAVAVLMVVAGLALMLAWGLAAVVRSRAKSTFAPTVLQGALGQTRPNQDRWVGVTLRDGTVFDGRLSSYPFTDTPDELIIALEAPVRRLKAGVVKKLPDHRLVLTGKDITSVSLQYHRTAIERTATSRRKRVANRLGKALQRYSMN